MVGTLIRERRRALGLSQEELATRLEMHQTYLSRLERGEVELPQRATLERLGRELSIGLAEFYQASGVLADVDDQPPPGDPLRERAREIIERPRVREQIAAAGGITEEVANAIEDVLVTVLKATTRRDPRT